MKSKYNDTDYGKIYGTENEEESKTKFHLLLEQFQSWELSKIEEIKLFISHATKEEANQSNSDLESTARLKQIFNDSTRLVIERILKSDQVKPKDVIVDHSKLLEDFDDSYSFGVKFLKNVARYNTTYSFSNDNSSSEKEKIEFDIVDAKRFRG